MDKNTRLFVFVLMGNLLSISSKDKLNFQAFVDFEENK